MPLFALPFPPGVYRNGTDSQGKGRFRDSNLVRWTEGTLRPMGGWELHCEGPLDGSARAILTWTDNSAVRWIAVGTHSNLYALTRTGDFYDITPSGYTPGNPGAVVGGGYGNSGYGDGDYGVPGTDPGLVDDCTVWSLDNFGENLVGCTAEDGVIYKWELDTGTPAAALGGDAPTNNRALVVTEEGFLMVLGADGNPRLVQWADQQSDSVWTPDATNQAGNFPLQTSGRLMCGRRIAGGTLLLTDQDVHLATFQGPPLGFGFERVGTGCGVISQGAAVVGGDGIIAWMSKSGFWTFDGYAKPLPCEVSDYVFGRLNTIQKSRITGFHGAAFGEITWLYPSTGSSECDSYVRWNYRENHWAIGSLDRTCGAGEGVYPKPLLVTPEGEVYAHESGFDYDGDEPYAETGPIEIDTGDRVYTATELIPDENTVGDVEATFYAKYLPTGEETTYGPYQPNTRTDVRFSARQARMRLTGARPADWRIGTFKIRVMLGGLR